VKISGKDLKDLIPDGIVFEVGGIGLHSRDQSLAVLNLECSEGSMSVVVYKKSVGKLLMKVPTPAAEPVKPVVEDAPARSEEEAPAQAAASDDGGRRIGMTRKKDGKTETLKGFTATGSIREKPANAERRVKHPDTGELVWPLWE
jgi:hypothetical protein